MHLLGDSYSPYLVGLIADITYPGDSAHDAFKGLQLGLMTCPIICLIGSAMFFIGGTFYVADKQAAMDQMGIGSSEEFVEEEHDDRVELLGPLE